MSTPSTPLRVLVLDHTARLSGAELALVRVCRAIDPRTVAVRGVVFAPGPLVDALEATGVPTAVLPLDPEIGTASRAHVGALLVSAARSAGHLVRFTADLSRMIRRSGADVVVTNSLKADLLTLVPAALARRPLVWHVHDRIASDYLPAPLVRLVRLAARLPARLVANSAATAATLPRAAVVAHPGVEETQILDRPRPVRPGPPVIGILGRISPTKGQLELVRALAQVVRQHPEATLRVVGAPLFGEEGYEAAVRREAERLGVASRITWTGAVGDPCPEVDRMTVLVHASPVPEPFGQVVVEAMARGVPVVATDAGGIPEIVGRGDRSVGTLVAPGDVAALADAVVAVLDDLPAAVERAERARRRVQTDFTVGRTARIVTEVWSAAARRA